MGLFDRLRKKNEVKTEVKGLEENRELVFTNNSFATISALYPSELDVLNNSAVWSAVRYISSVISTLPLHVFKKDGRVRDIDYTHPISKVLNTPNPYMTKSVFIEVMAINLELFGVSYAEITWTENTLNKYPKMILPISPRDIQVKVEKGNIRYFYIPNGEEIVKENLIVVMGSSLNGILPLNPIKYMKPSLEVASAGERLQKKYFEKGTMMGGVISVPRDYTNEDKQRLKVAFDSAFTGVGNAFGTVVLNEGIKYEPIKFNAEDSELLGARNFTIQDVARRFGVSPYALGDLSHATFSNVEQQSLNDIKHTFRPRIVKFEEAFNQKLFNKKDADKNYIKFSIEGLLRGDTSTRYNAYNVALQTGFLTRNEIRALEDMNPIEGADDLFVPLNMTTLDIAKDYNPNSPPSHYGYYNVGEVKEEVIEEKVDYLEERVKITRSSKAKIEILVRKMLKQEIELLFKELEELETKGKEVFKKDYASGVNNITREYTEEFNKVFNDIALRLNPIIAKELGKTNLTGEDEILDFVEKYTEGFIHRHSGKIVGDVYRVVERNTQDTLRDEIEDRINDWKINLPAQTREEESVRSSNAFTKTLFVAYGVSKMKAVANYDACPICQQLDGKIVSIEGNFIDKNNDFEDGEGNKVYFRKSYSHPPWHQFCQCSIAPAD